VPVQLVVVDRAAFLDSIGAHPRSTHAAHSVAEERLLMAGVGGGRLTTSPVPAKLSSHLRAG
jgi:hypothetical protein